MRLRPQVKPVSAPLHVVCPKCDITNRVLRERLAAAKCGACKRPLFDGHPAELTASNFERQIATSGVPLVVDFWAPWCGPCRTMAPAYEQAAARLEPRVRLAKLNTENAPDIAARFGIRGIPTLIAFAGGREVGRQSGALDVAGVMGFVDMYLGSSIKEH